MNSRLSTFALTLAILVACVSALGQTTGARTASNAPAHNRALTQNIECSECHTEVEWKTLKGSISAHGFDHARTGFPLTGRHRHAACTSCHRADRPITRECVGCHEDAHSRRLSQACDGCHSSQSWSQVSAISLHRRTRLPLTGMHVLAECTECHQRTAEHRWRTVPADCYSCHADDYRRQDIHPLHTGVPSDPTQPPLPRDCALCHRANSFSPAFAPASFAFRPAVQTQALRSAAHDLKFPISFGKHRQLACADCHTTEAEPRLVRCTGCHTHNPVALSRQHQRVGPVHQDCLRCHAGGAKR